MRLTLRLKGFDIMKTDNRYQIELEWCGYVTQRHVLRFCGSFIGSYVTKKEANEAQVGHAAIRL